MTARLRCPFCSSEKVYSLLNTLHCKRCKNMWKPDAEHPDPDTYGYYGDFHNPVLRIVKKTDPLETRLEKRLNEYLEKFHGTFCMETAAWVNGDISQDLFRRYLRTCVRKKVLFEKRDRYGRTWYSGTGKPAADDRSARGNRRAGRTAHR